MYRSSPCCSTLNRNVIEQVWACLKYVPKQSMPCRSTFNAIYITSLGMCKVCTEAVHAVALNHRCRSMYRSTRCRSTCEHERYHRCRSMYRSTRCCSTLNRNVIITEVCTEAVHSVADQPAAFVQHPEHGDSMLHFIHPCPERRHKAQNNALGHGVANPAVSKNKVRPPGTSQNIKLALLWYMTASCP